MYICYSIIFLLVFSNPFVFSKSVSKASIILGISFIEQSKHIHCNESGYVKYFSCNIISFLHAMHFFNLYGSVFFIIIQNSLQYRLITYIKIYFIYIAVIDWLAY
ncbi:MAG TPA: hypothetical protein VHJ38_10700, partial [Nitrososphaeraceae archaeon]|nr:hypothetical protein [Nitrososphaeraceae archaeon]